MSASFIIATIGFAAIGYGLAFLLKPKLFPTDWLCANDLALGRRFGLGLVLAGSGGLIGFAVIYLIGGPF